MFGFFSPARNDPAYRRIYAGCCAHQHNVFGLRTLPFLSYEAVFLYLVAVDAKVCPGASDDTATCCRLRKRGSRLHTVDSPIATFCSSFGVLLASIKLEDDVRDQRSWLARAALWSMRSAVTRAYERLAALDPQFRRRVDQIIDDHLQLERSTTAQDIQEYAGPTGDAFGYVFELFHAVLPTTAGLSKQALRQLGDDVGRSIIYFDCVNDWERDRRRGDYNPLANAEQREAARLLGQQTLARIGWNCRELFGDSCHTGTVATATFSRCRDKNPQVAGRRVSSRPAWWTRRRGACDACAECGCASCEGCSGDCALECCCQSCFSCDGVFCIDGCEHKGRNAAAKPTHPATPGEPPVRAGTIAVTRGELNPTGVVVIGGTEFPAIAEGGYIANGVQVEVIAQKDVGLIVRVATADN